MATDPAPPTTSAPAPGPSSSAPSSSSSKAPERAPDDTVFRTAFAGISDTVAQGQYANVVALAERADLAGDARSPARLLVVAPMVLAYLIVDDLTPARFALSRLPEQLQGLPIVQGLASLVALAWQRRYDLVYTRAEGLFTVASDFEEPIAQVLHALLRQFVESFRERTFHLLSRAYNEVPLSLVETYLGLPAQQIVPAAQSRGWAYDEAHKLFRPVKPRAVSASAAKSDISSLKTFHFVASSVGKLET
ncbi:COP9 signalosome [Schizophyllum fasciatum]